MIKQFDNTNLNASSNASKKSRKDITKEAAIRMQWFWDLEHLSNLLDFLDPQNRQII
jgi:hypothetical protein